jgi:hypothetical protein
LPLLTAITCFTPGIGWRSAGPPWPPAPIGPLVGMAGVGSLAGRRG